MATSAQLPQVVAQPVMAFRSDRVRAPASPAARTARSVIPLQRQTYMAGIPAEMRMIVNNRLARTSGPGHSSRMFPARTVVQGRRGARQDGGAVGHHVRLARQVVQGLGVDPALEVDHVLERVPEIDPAPGI